MRASARPSALKRLLRTFVYDQSADFATALADARFGLTKTDAYASIWAIPVKATHQACLLMSAFALWGGRHLAIGEMGLPNTSANIKRRQMHLGSWLVVDRSSLTVGHVPPTTNAPLLMNPLTGFIRLTPGS